VRWFPLFFALLLTSTLSARAGDVKDTEVYARLKASLDAIPAIDTHSHLRGPSDIQRAIPRDPNSQRPLHCTLSWVWARSYYTNGHRLPPWPNDDCFETWWAAAQKNFDNSRARSAYRS